MLAIIDVAQGVQLDTLRARIAEEVKGSWRLFVAGIVREAYATATPSRIVFVLEASDSFEAKRHLGTLPLVAAGVLQSELIELHPFQNWSLLFAP